MSIPPWARRKTLSNRAHQEIIDEVNRQAELDGTGDLYRGQDGHTIIDSRQETYFLRALAVIIAPEDATHTYTDPRYRCQIQRIIFGEVPEDLVKLDKDDNILNQFEGATEPNDSEDTPIGWTVTATNTTEITNPLTGAGSHDLTEDGTVVVEIFAIRACVEPEAEEEGDVPPAKESIRWFFTSGGLHSKGKYQGTEHIMRTQNEDGWGFGELHPPLI